jgi:hypothetical protein
MTKLITPEELWVPLATRECIDSIRMYTCLFCQGRIYPLKHEGLIRFLQADQQTKLALYCPQCKCIWLTNDKDVCKAVKLGYHKIELLYPLEVKEYKYTPVSIDPYAGVMRANSQRYRITVTPDVIDIAPEEVEVGDYFMYSDWFRQIDYKILSPLIDGRCFCRIGTPKRKFEKNKVSFECTCGLLGETTYIAPFQYKTILKLGDKVVELQYDLSVQYIIPSMISILKELKNAGLIVVEAPLEYEGEGSEKR